MRKAPTSADPTTKKCSHCLGTIPITVTGDPYGTDKDGTPTHNEWTGKFDDKRLSRRFFRANFRVNRPLSLCVQSIMQFVKDLDSEAIERLRKQGGFLLTIYHAEIAKGPTSRATESSRSNVIAMQHTVRQMYGEAVARDVAALNTAALGCQA